MKAWRNAQKMREFFTLGDMRQSAMVNDFTDLPPSLPLMEREDSLHPGASDAQIATAAAHIVRRVPSTPPRFASLLCAHG
jgi:hypothetical protein